MLAVIMQRKTLDNKWVSHHWEAIAVVPDSDSGASALHKLFEDPESTQWLFPGLELRLYGDEAENYLLNVGAPEPRVFVMWRLADEAAELELATPQRVTVSYGEAARMMDSGEQVDGVPLPEDLLGWIEDFARGHYRPPEKKQKGKRYASSKPGTEPGNA